MVQKVICKMQCHQNTGEARISEEKGDSTAHIKMGAVWEGTIEAQRASENAIFGRYSPWGSFEMGIANPDTASFFVPGQKYYVTFTKAPD